MTAAVGDDRDGGPTTRRSISLRSRLPPQLAVTVASQRAHPESGPKLFLTNVYKLPGHTLIHTNLAQTT